ncbi:MAG TPA: HTH domain-containing protein [Spirochaetota bacterium]|nr:HTH domain-containing protein [Spirochaetota bacterium]
MDISRLSSEKNNSEKEKFKVIFRRLLKIHEEIGAKKYPNKNTLKKELEVSDSTIARDIEYMKLFLNAPIEYDKSKKGYYYATDTYYFPAFFYLPRSCFLSPLCKKS